MNGVAGCDGGGMGPRGAYTERNRFKSGWGGTVVIGLGTDLIEIERIAHSVERYGEAFLRRVFTDGEIAYCQRKKKNPAESFAARFAAKEAGAKALGTGISRGVSWLELEVRRLPGQRPELYLSGRAEEVARALGIRRMSLSLAHSRGMSIAVVVAED
jgi:holo-[acyl-carrier protein] synthase